MDDFSRRRFVTLSCAALGACATCPSAARSAHAASGVSASQEVPPVAAAAPAEPFDAGDAQALTEGFTDTFAQSHQIILVRTGDRIHAMSATCTHQGFTVKKSADKPAAELRCPKHGSRFNLEGKTVRGPGTGFLARHGVELKAGKLWVNPAKIFLEGDFENDGAFVQLTGGGTKPAPERPTTRPASRQAGGPATRPTQNPAAPASGQE